MVMWSGKLEHNVDLVSISKDINLHSFSCKFHFLVGLFLKNINVNALVLCDILRDLIIIIHQFCCLFIHNYAF